MLCLFSRPTLLRDWERWKISVMWNLNGKFAQLKDKATATGFVGTRVVQMTVERSWSNCASGSVDVVLAISVFLCSLFQHWLKWFTFSKIEICTITDRLLQHFSTIHLSSQSIQVLFLLIFIHFCKNKQNIYLITLEFYWIIKIPTIFIQKN